MRISFLLLLAFAYSNPLYSQQKVSKTNFDIWLKGVVNIETEGYIYPKYFVDSVCASKKDSEYSSDRLDSLRNSLMTTKVGTGTAIYASYKNRNYLITAKHVINDQNSESQKIFEEKAGLKKWNKFESVYPRISLRTPFKHYFLTNTVNNYAVIINNFRIGPRPFLFIYDSSGEDGLAVISLQERSFKEFDLLLKKNGYIPLPLERIISNDSIKVLDEIFTIGFPERVSVMGRIRKPDEIEMFQSRDLVAPIIVKGAIAMCESNVPLYYADLTTYPGNSGSPIIRNGKLIGIISGINKYRIFDESGQGSHNLFGIGHLVNIITTKNLIQEIENFINQEDEMSKN